MIRLITAAIAAPVLAFGGVAAAAAEDAADTTLSSSTATRISYLREEERMAHDLYTVFAGKYGQDSEFARIARAETRHFDRMGTLIQQYGLTDPSAGKPAGQYADAKLQSLYDGWKTRGLTSETEARKVGAELERADIADLDQAIALDSPADVERAFSALRRGSAHHLAAFTGQVTEHGTQAAGRGAGQGRGPGRGDGTGQGRGHGRGAGTGDCTGDGPGSGQSAGPGAGQGTDRR